MSFQTDRPTELSILMDRAIEWLQERYQGGDDSISFPLFAISMERGERWEIADLKAVYYWLHLMGYIYVPELELNRRHS